MLFSSRFVRSFGVGLVGSVVGIASIACSSSSDNTGGTPNPATGSGGGGNSTGGTTGGPDLATCDSPILVIQFSPMYSAFIEGGAHTFKVPAQVTGLASGVSSATAKWATSDDSIVAHEPDPTTGAEMFTVQKAGTVHITAHIGDACGATDLTVSAATEEQWKAGSDRYNNNNPLPKIDTSNITALIATFQSGANPLESTTAPPACANCHDANAAAVDALFKGVTHTPMQTAGFSDDQLKQVIMNATLPPGAYYNDAVGIPKTIWSRYHKWTDVTDEQAAGLVTYLRSLEPKKAGGCYDFSSVIPSGVTIPAGANTNNCSSGGAAGAGGTPATGTGGTTP